MLSTVSHFTARYYASSLGLFAVVMCLSVCLSVRPSVCHKPVQYCIETTGRIKLVFGMVASSTCVIRKFEYLQNKGTFFWNFVPDSAL